MAPLINERREHALLRFKKIRIHRTHIRVHPIHHLISTLQITLIRGYIYIFFGLLTAGATGIR